MRISTVEYMSAGKHQVKLYNEFLYNLSFLSLLFFTLSPPKKNGKSKRNMEQNFLNEKIQAYVYKNLTVIVNGKIEPGGGCIKGV